MDKIIKELNDNSNLKYKLGIKQPTTFKGDYKKVNNFMSLDIYEPSKNYERILSFYSLHLHYLQYFYVITLQLLQVT